MPNLYAYVCFYELDEDGQDTGHCLAIVQTIPGMKQAIDALERAVIADGVSRSAEHRPGETMAEIGSLADLLRDIPEEVIHWNPDDDDDDDDTEGSWDGDDRNVDQDQEGPGYP